MFRSRTRKNATSLFPPAFRRGLRMEWLEDRCTPATFFVDDNLVAGADVTTLNNSNPGYQVIDQVNDGVLGAGDIVRVTLPGAGSSTDFTFATSAPAGNSDLLAFQNISTALTAAANTAGTDTIDVGPGTYAEAATLNVNSTVTITGVPGITAATTDVVAIDPTSAVDAVTVSATGVTIQNVLITGAVNGIVTSGNAVTDLTLTNVSIGGDNPATAGTVESNTGVGLNLTGAGGGTLTLTGVTLAGNTGTGGAGTVGGFATVNLTVGGSTAATVTVNGAATGGTSVQVSTASTTGQALTFSGTPALTITGSSAADLFVVTPPASGGANAAQVTIDGGAPAGTTGTAGDRIQLANPANLTVSATAGASGFSGTITSGSTVTVNFQNIESFPQGSTISGRVIVDANKNNTADTGEGGLAGLTVFLDLDNSGTLNTGDISTTTDANGNFTFTGLPPLSGGGSYNVRVDAKSGVTVLTTQPQTVTINSFGATTSPVNFLVQLTAGGTVSGVVFNDTNGNGTMDSGESPIQGVTVYLDLNQNGSLDTGEPSVVTGANGTYSLSTATDDSTVNVQVLAPLPSGFQLPANFTAPTVSLTGGISVTQKNIPLVQTSTGATGGTVTGFVYADVNPNNNQRDTGEAGIRGVRVYLDLNNNGKLDNNEPTAITDANGAYTLTTTQNGTFQVRAVLSPGYLRTSGFPSVTLTGNTTVSNVDIGLFTNLPPQATPARRLAAGYIIGGQAHVKMFDQDGNVLNDIPVFAGLNMADVRVAVADVTGDGVDDIIVGTGPGVPTQVVVLDGTNLQVIARITPFESTFTGGVYVAAGDLNGDGINDIIVSPDQGGGPRVLVYAGGAPGSSGAFTQIASFLGIDDINFRGGCRVTVADINRDGIPDLIVAAGFLGGPRVAVYNGANVLTSLTRLFNDFFIFEQTLRNGAYITAGDIDGDGFADLIAGGGPGGGPRVLAISGADLMAGKGIGSKVLANFFAGDQNNRGGVRVTAKDIDGDGHAEIFTGSGDNTHGHVHGYRGNGDDAGFDFDAGDNNGAFVG